MWPTETSSGRTMMEYAALGTKKQQATKEKSKAKNAVSADGLNPVVTKQRAHHRTRSSVRRDKACGLSAFHRDKSNLKKIWCPTHPPVAQQATTISGGTDSGRGIWTNLEKGQQGNGSWSSDSSTSLYACGVGVSGPRPEASSADPTRACGTVTEGLCHSTLAALAIPHVGNGPRLLSTCSP